MNVDTHIPRPLPGESEERMLGAIARCTLFEAVRHGDGHASFLGYDIDAFRLGIDRAGYPRIEVTLRVTENRKLLERAIFVVEVPAAH